MSDYLKREDVLENVLSQMTISDSMKAMSERIWNLQEADVVERELYDRALSDVVRLSVERETGKWRENGEPNAYGKFELWYYDCSLCGAVGIQEYNYCPNCGARMVTDDV